MVEMVVTLVAAHEAPVSAEEVKEAGEAATEMAVAARVTVAAATAREMAVVATVLAAVVMGTVATVKLVEGMARGGRSRWGSLRAPVPAALENTTDCYSRFGRSRL